MNSSPAGDQRRNEARPAWGQISEAQLLDMRLGDLQSQNAIATKVSFRVVAPMAVDAHGRNLCQRDESSIDLACAHAASQPTRTVQSLDEEDFPAAFVARRPAQDLIFGRINSADGEQGIAHRFQILWAGCLGGRRADDDGGGWVTGRD